MYPTRSRQTRNRGVHSVNGGCCYHDRGSKNPDYRTVFLGFENLGAWLLLEFLDHGMFENSEAFAVVIVEVDHP